MRTILSFRRYQESDRYCYCDCPQLGGKRKTNTDNDYFIFSRFGRGVPQSRPGESLHEVRAAQGDLAGELRAILRICRLQKQIGCSGIYQLHLLTTILNDSDTFNFKSLVFPGRVHRG